MRKTKNVGMIFALAVGAWYVFRQVRQARAAQAELAAPVTVSGSIARNAYEK